VTARVIRIAVIGGSGVGPEVVAEAVKVIQAAAGRSASTGPAGGEATADPVVIEANGFDLGERSWPQARVPPPREAVEEIAGHDAILIGTLGDRRASAAEPEPGPLRQLQAELDQCVTIRPVRLFPGAVSPIADLRPESVDIEVLRATIPGWSSEDRLIRYALRRAAQRPGHRLALVHAAVPEAGWPWGEAAERLLAGSPEVTAEFLAVDFAAMYLVTEPERFDVVATDAAVGDTMSLLGAAITGGIRLAAGASVNPDGTTPGMFGPVHGSASQIAGQQKADPTAAILAAGMLCAHLGLDAQAARIDQAVVADLLERQSAWQARSTGEVGDDIAERVAG
jgi:3-isopropylmalate dehydrogenase